ncbi:MAG: CCA tRNA nucleotidyltransferase [Methanomicrobiales archaeon]|nr:CCA tRNA nucleotidyltransferase [Methanomicrobiales archaeon]
MVMRSPIEEVVLEGIRPKKKDIDHITTVAERLVAAVDRSGIAEGMVVGSIARHTWLNGDRDLDIFMLFDPSLPREDLEDKGLSLARSIATEFGARYREKYAEHPYLNAQLEELDIDLVPCYRVPSAWEIQSAVDRTPFHTRYISERINPLIDDVLLFKQFAKAGGFYGSDQMTEGFAGYLCELLVYYYGGFIPLIRAASSWKKRTIIDIEGIGAKSFEDSLVVIDPVDPNRNVAASVSLTRKFEFVELARGYLSSPSAWFFTVIDEPPITQDELRLILTQRETALYGLFIRTPPFIPDIVVPQLRKSLGAIRGLLERHGFVVNRADCCMGDERCLMILELLVDRLPQVRRHIGPPLWTEENAGKFFSKERGAIFSGPYIEDGLYVVEIPRRYTDVASLLSSGEVLETGLGKHVKHSMREGWRVVRGADCWAEEFAPFLSRFLNRSSPLGRIRLREAQQNG